MYEFGCTIEVIAESVGESIERVNEVINAYKERSGVSEAGLCKRREEMIEKKEWADKVYSVQNMYNDGLTIELISKYL